LDKQFELAIDTLTKLDCLHPDMWQIAMRTMLVCLPKEIIQVELAVGDRTFKRWLDGSGSPREMSRRLLKPVLVEILKQQGDMIGLLITPDKHPHRADRKLELRILIKARRNHIKDIQENSDEIGFGEAAGMMFIQKQIDAWQDEYEMLYGELPDRLRG
jgi:hypothetical protein